CLMIVMRLNPTVKEGCGCLRKARFISITDISEVLQKSLHLPKEDSHTHSGKWLQCLIVHFGLPLSTAVSSDSIRAPQNGIHRTGTWIRYFTSLQLCFMTQKEIAFG